MIWKVLAVVALLALPFSVALWYKSHRSPQQYRYDVTLYKSLRIKLKAGVCGLRLLSMPTRTGGRSEFREPFHYDAAPGGRSFFLRSVRSGPYRITWLAFPLWCSTFVLIGVGAVPLVQGPVRRSWRRWHGRCEECGYDLRGTRGVRCSECGTRFR